VDAIFLEHAAGGTPAHRKAAPAGNSQILSEVRENTIIGE